MILTKYNYKLSEIGVMTVARGGSTGSIEPPPLSQVEPPPPPART